MIQSLRYRRGVLVVLALLAGCGPGTPPSLQDMAGEYAGHREQFETLRRMSEEDYPAAGLYELSKKRLKTETQPPRPRVMTDERVQAYLGLFRKVGAEELERPEEARDTSVRFLLWSWGYFDSSIERGVMYSPTAQENYKGYEDEYRFMPLGGGWYAYGMNGWQGDD
jgi:hypothetical protein